MFHTKLFPQLSPTMKVSFQIHYVISHYNISTSLLAKAANTFSFLKNYEKLRRFHHFWLNLRTMQSFIVIINAWNKIKVNNLVFYKDTYSWYMKFMCIIIRLNNFWILGWILKETLYILLSVCLFFLASILVFLS